MKQKQKKKIKFAFVGLKDWKPKLLPVKEMPLTKMFK